MPPSNSRFTLPIAGWNSASASDGLTTQYLYDDNLSDTTGLSSSGGVSVNKLSGSGSYAVSLSAALTKLASTEGNGGAEITFNSDAPGRAVVVINPEEEISFSISDATGRTVMSGQLMAIAWRLVRSMHWVVLQGQMRISYTGRICRDTLSEVKSFNECESIFARRVN